MSNLPSRRAYRCLPIAAVLLALAACRAQPAYSHRLDPELRARFEEARRLEDAGRSADAARIHRAIVAADPDFVAAHRALQNLEIGEHRRGELLVRYLAFREAAPRSGDRWYLWGRLLTDPAEQREAFETAHRLTPNSPWPLLGLGAVELASGETREAIELLGRARELAPDLRDVELAYVRALLGDVLQLGDASRMLAGALDAEPWDVSRVLLYADLRVRLEHGREAIEVLGQLLARYPANTEVAARLLERLERDGTAEDAVWLERELDGAGAEPMVASLLARCHAMRGDSGAAIAMWNALPELSAEERSWRRLLHVLRGELPQAIADESTRFSALARLDAQMPAWREATRTLARRAAGEELDRVALADALRRMGWVDEAIALLRPGVRSEPTSEAASRLLVQLFAQRQLEAELKVLAVENYRAFADGRTVPDFDRFLERVGAASRRALGEDRTKDAPMLSYWPIGSLLDPTANQGIAAWFRESGRLLVAGQRRGRPPELQLAALVATARTTRPDAELFYVDGTLVPGFLEHQGARFSGAAFGRFLYVDVAAVEDDVARILAIDRRFGAERERILADPVLPAASASARTSVTEPAEVATKLELRALAEWRARDPRQERAQLLAEALDGVLAHETGHLEDAARFLPLSTQVWGHLGELIRLGFSPRRIEEWLEMRAECIALARAANPHLVLGACVGQLAGSSTLTPHGSGYRELLQRLVEVMDESPADFPGLDRDKVLLQQLDRLSADEIRLAARRVMADLGIE